MHRPLLILIIFALLLTSCDAGSIGNAPANQPAVEPVQDVSGDPAADATTSSDWYQVYFTDTVTPGIEGGTDADIVEAIGNARASVDAALYDLNLWSIRDALIAAHQRGVTVRVVTESDNYAREEALQELVSAGIPVVGDENDNGLMHDKFFVIDQYEIWTGSMNITINGVYDNDNNLIRIFSARLAENYLNEFNEMFNEGLFGENSRPGSTPHPALEINGTRVENYFSPDDGVEARIVELINNAQSTVYFMAFTFTSNPITEALIAAHERGVEVAGVVERAQNRQQGADYETLLTAGIDVREDGNNENMHHKVFIIDGQIVWTGSYNFTRAANERNDENVLVLYNADIASIYMNEFVRVMLQAVQP